MARFTKTRIAASAGVLVAGVWASSMALFTDAVDEHVSFSSGTLDLAGSGSAALLNVSDMAPGDVAYAPLTLTNAGTLELRWSMTSTATDAAFSSALSFAVVSDATCDAGTSFASPIASGVAGGGLALGDPASGAQSGDQALAPGASSQLCFRVSFDVNADNLLQNRTTDVTLSFAAEQTANNP